MTKNQIEFLKHLETKRANQAQERETNRSNLEKEQHNRNVLGETNRHNLVTEQQSFAVLEETSRHNRTTEIETGRHNLATELLGRDTLFEQQRANLARESLQREANQETRRANLAKERYNEIVFSETQRANRAKENLQAQSIGVQREQLNETQRANLRNEQLRAEQQAETIRFNDLTHTLNERKQSEIERSNRANEMLSGASNVTRAGELAEKVRHNLAWEGIMATKSFGSTNIVSPVIQPSSQVSTPQLPSSTTSVPRLNVGSGFNSSEAPLKSRSSSANPMVGITYESVPQNLISKLGDAATLTNRRIAVENYADGSKKYYLEVFDNGKVKSRKEISQKELGR